MRTDTLVNCVLELSESQPEKTALIFRKEKLSYGEFGRRIRTAAALLAKRGVKRGDRVLYTAMSKMETFVFLLGIQYLGATAVPTDKIGKAEHELSLYDDAEAALLLTALKIKDIPSGKQIVTQKEFLTELKEAENTVDVPPYEFPDKEDYAEILFTSGTTGKPKGVILSFRAVWDILNNTKNGIGIRGDDVVLMPLPLHHSLALRVCRATLVAGGTLVLQNGFAFAKETEQNQLTHACTGMVAVPVSMELLRGQMQEHFYEIMGRFRFIEVGSGALSVEQRKRLSRMLPDTQITNTWGSSETGGVMFTYVHDVAENEERVSTLGLPIAGAEVMFLANGADSDAQLHETAEASCKAERSLIGRNRDNPGRLAIRGDMVMSGYYGRPDETADALRDGWLVTNDLCYSDEEGYLFMLGRSDDIINIGGEKLSPLEVENIASEYEGAGEYACIGVPDPDGILGHVPVLFVGKCREDYSAVELRKYLATRLERIKIPARIIEVEELPRNRMQKLDRRAIAALYKA